jgi:ELP3 family radical SAM enzyme/protein acetyltransferase
MGHIPDKLEIIVLGGTWSEYPRNYQDCFITDLYYAANSYFDSEQNEHKRPKLSLEEEIEINETAKIHIIGLTLETRPDTITLEEITNFRRYNCTRIQLGVQHTNNAILKKIMRGHTIERAYEAIKLLKNNCYKVDIHIMPNLPAASYEIDKAMLEEILYDERIQVDQYKIYPTAIVPYTRIKRWFDEGSYVPYDDLLLYELIKEFKKKVQKYKRLNRIIRDIPGHYIEGGYSTKFVNMRQLLQNDMRLNKWGCECIRCREVKGNYVSLDNIKLNIEKYKASGGDEYHISFDTDCDKNYLIGFLRLRLSGEEAISASVLPCIQGCALIRELHVYSNISDVGNNIEGSLQHKGYGKQLVAKAEEIARDNGYRKVAIISGTGVRGYYKKLGYQLIDTYMIKDII